MDFFCLLCELPYAQHGDGMNASFVDGHAAYRKRVLESDGLTARSLRGLVERRAFGMDGFQ